MWFQDSPLKVILFTETAHHREGKTFRKTVRVFGHGVYSTLVILIVSLKLYLIIVTSLDYFNEFI